MKHVVVGALFGGALLWQACGGCYNRFEVEAPGTDPPTPCLGVSASAVDDCNAAYRITVANDCAEPLVAAGKTIAPGASGTFAHSDARLGKEGRREIEGRLGATTVFIIWSHSDPPED